MEKLFTHTKWKPFLLPNQNSSIYFVKGLPIRCIVQYMTCMQKTHNYALANRQPAEALRATSAASPGRQCGGQSRSGGKNHKGGYMDIHSLISKYIDLYGFE